MDRRIDGTFVALACLTSFGASLAGSWWIGGPPEFGLAFASCAAAGVGWALYAASRTTVRSASRMRAASLLTGLMALALGLTELGQGTRSQPTALALGWLVIGVGFLGLWLHQRTRRDVARDR